jgi:hypothetical protein
VTAGRTRGRDRDLDALGGVDAPEVENEVLLVGAERVPVERETVRDGGRPRHVRRVRALGRRDRDGVNPVLNCFELDPTRLLSGERPMHGEHGRSGPQRRRERTEPGVIVDDIHVFCSNDFESARRVLHLDARRVLGGFGLWVGERRNEPRPCPAATGADDNHIVSCIDKAIREKSAHQLDAAVAGWRHLVVGRRKDRHP